MSFPFFDQTDHLSPHSVCEAREASSEDNSSDSGQKNNFVTGQDTTVDTTMQLPPQPAAPGESDDVLNNDGEMQLELKEVCIIIHFQFLYIFLLLFCNIHVALWELQN